MLVWTPKPESAWVYVKGVNLHSTTGHYPQLGIRKKIIIIHYVFLVH